MDAIIYTRAKEEYELLRETLQEEVKVINIEWAIPEEGCRDYAFDLLVTTMEPEEAFDIIDQHREKRMTVRGRLFAAMYLITLCGRSIWKGCGLLSGRLCQNVRVDLNGMMVHRSKKKEYANYEVGIIKEKH